MFLRISLTCFNNVRLAKNNSEAFRQFSVELQYLQCVSNVLSIYRQISNIGRTLECNKLVDHSDVVGASPVGAAPTTSSFST